jgi:hypothetical protein
MVIEHSVRRYDIGEIGKVERTPQGFLKVPGFATRVGVFVYRDSSGAVRRELRHPDDVMAPESMQTLKYAPVTIEHPPELISPTNVDLYRVGHATEKVEVNRDLVETELIIEDQKAIDAVEIEGIRELSSGYEADIVQEDGVWNGNPYDYRQKNIRYNHIAMVKRGRAGPEVRLRLDSADAVMEVSKPGRAEFGTQSSVMNSDNESAPTKKKIVIAGRELELPETEADIIQDMLDRYDEIRGKALHMEAQMEGKEKKDMDISQPGISPQVKVTQMAPDGRSGAGKVGPESTLGPAKAKGIADEDVKKPGDQSGVVGGPAKLGKADEDEKEEKKDYEAPGMAGAAMSPVDQLKHELEEIEQASLALAQKKDAVQAKMDAMANESIGKGEAKMDSADVQAQIRRRVKLERTAEKLVPFEVSKRFDSMSDIQIMKAVIKHRAPKADLEGKSAVYVESRFDSIVESEDSSEPVRKQYGSAALRTDSKDNDPAQARLKMVSESRELWKQPLSASKK